MTPYIGGFYLELKMNPSINTLNQGQQAAADGFFEFLFSKEKELIISGPGGVGKTFLMGHLIDQIMPQYHQTCQLMGLKAEYQEVVMTATTNKAAEVLGSNTGRPAETIQSFLNLKVVDNYVTGVSDLIKTRNWKMHHKKIIFVDEASMIDNPLLTHLREATCDCKIVFVGDHCQLAPVKEPISPIYKQRLPFFELTEPMRNNGQPALMSLCSQLRLTVETGDFAGIKLTPGVVDHFSDAQMEAFMRHTFSCQNTNSRILAYTNQRVTQYNEFIRDIRQYTSTYIEGETLVNNSAIQLSTGMLSVEEELTISELDQRSVMHEIEPGVELEVVLATLDTPYGDQYTDVPLPVDKNHYTALVKHYQKQKNWNRYFYLKNKFPDLRPKDASTVHKSQGSTYDTVIIDLTNLSTCHNPNQAARLLYVAVTRARHRIILFGELASKYGGIIK